MARTVSLSADQHRRQKRPNSATEEMSTRKQYLPNNMICLDLYTVSEVDVCKLQIKKI